MTQRPEKSKAELIADERAAEATVVKAEYGARKAEVSGDAEAVDAARQAVDAARTESLRVRKVMTDGLAQWHAYDSEQELGRVAREIGLPPEEVSNGA